MVTERQFEDTSEWRQAAVARVAVLLEIALQQRGHASLLLSGGNTPAPVLRGLRDATIDWSRVVVSLVDERLVPPDHPDSNQRLVTDTLDPEGLGAEFVPLYADAPSATAAAELAARRLAALPYPFDVVLLGMGGDGHTASLFAGAPEFAAATAAHAPLCVAITPPAASHTRLSLSLAALLAARHRLLLISGEEKWTVYRAATTRDDPETLPISALLHRADEGTEVYWHA